MQIFQIFNTLWREFEIHTLLARILFEIHILLARIIEDIVLGLQRKCKHIDLSPNHSSLSLVEPIRLEEINDGLRQRKPEPLFFLIPEVVENPPVIGRERTLQLLQMSRIPLEELVP